jgi:L-ascorbate 6-phosphate lactonase
MDRMQPIFIRPEELETDVYACTHSHYDHADPLTIRNLRNKDTMQFVGPSLTCRKYEDYGIESSRIVPVWPEEEICYRDVKIRGTFALPTDTSDLNHIGFLLTFGDRYKVYVTGDTDHSELLASVAKHSPQVLITCINGNYNNLSHWEAAELAKWIDPKVAIPCHYDMFPENAMDPAQFRASLKIRAPKVSYLELAHAEPQLLE